MRGDDDIREAEDVIDSSDDEDDDESDEEEDEVDKATLLPMSIGSTAAPSFSHLRISEAMLNLGGWIAPSNSPFRFVSIFCFILSFFSLVGLIVLFSGVLNLDDGDEEAFDKNGGAIVPRNSGESPVHG